MDRGSRTRGRSSRTGRRDSPDYARDESSLVETQTRFGSNAAHKTGIARPKGFSRYSAARSLGVSLQRRLMPLQQAVAEIGLPTFGESSDAEGSFDDDQVASGKDFGNVEACDFRNGEAFPVPGKKPNRVAPGDLTFADNSQVEAGARTRQEALDHFVRPKADPKLVTG